MPRQPAGKPATGGTPPPSPNRAAARERLMACLAWGVAEGAITQEEAGEELARFDVETQEGDAG